MRQSVTQRTDCLCTTLRQMPQAIFLLTLLLLLLGRLANGQQNPTRQDTLNGSIGPERNWWDVQRYDLTIQPDYKSKTLTGKNIIRYQVKQKRFAYLMQIDLAQPLRIDSAFQNNQPVPYTRTGDVWHLAIPERLMSRINDLTIYYSGTPKESVTPPWDGGVVWASDSLGRPWLSVACQYTGARVWYPCKNTMQDQCDQGASVIIIVPDTLVAVGNGRLLSQQPITRWPTTGTSRNRSATTVSRFTWATTFISAVNMPGSAAR